MVNLLHRKLPTRDLGPTFCAVFGFSTGACVHKDHAIRGGAYAVMATLTSAPFLVRVTGKAA